MIKRKETCQSVTDRNLSNITEMTPIWTFACLKYLVLIFKNIQSRSNLAFSSKEDFLPPCDLVELLSWDFTALAVFILPYLADLTVSSLMDVFRNHVYSKISILFHSLSGLYVQPAVRMDAPVHQCNRIWGGACKEHLAYQPSAAAWWYYPCMWGHWATDAVLQQAHSPAWTGCQNWGKEDCVVLMQGFSNRNINIFCGLLSTSVSGKSQNLGVILTHCVYIFSDSSDKLSSLYFSTYFDFFRTHFLPRQSTNWLFQNSLSAQAK